MSTSIELQAGGTVTISCGPDKQMRLTVYPDEGAIMNTTEIAALRAMLESWADPLRQLEKGDTIEVMDSLGVWQRMTFLHWVADGLGAEFKDADGQLGGVGRTNIRIPA